MTYLPHHASRPHGRASGLPHVPAYGGQTNGGVHAQAEQGSGQQKGPGFCAHERALQLDPGLILDASCIILVPEPFPQLPGPAASPGGGGIFPRCPIRGATHVGMRLVASTCKWRVATVACSSAKLCKKFKAIRLGTRMCTMGWPAESNLYTS